MSKADEVAETMKQTKKRVAKALPSEIDGTALNTMSADQVFMALKSKREALSSLASRKNLLPLDIRALEQEIKRRAKEA